MHCSAVLLTCSVRVAQSLYQGIGLGLGGLVGGIMYHTYGPRAVFINAACVVAVGWAMCLLLQHVVPLFFKPKPLAGHGSSS
jgi:predicted MFS family arabinose efflux permease